MNMQQRQIKRTIAISALALGMTTSPALAQFPGGAIPVQDLVTEQNTGTIAQEDGVVAQNTTTIAQIEQQNILPGLAGGFDVSQTLSGDLEQQVSSAGGLPLVTGALSAYTTFWPGYTNASYAQSLAPGSPEGDMTTTLGTLQGALNAGADQQTSQQTEAARMTQLEAENGAATGNLQVQEVGNEIALFGTQEEIKQRNATNGTLNALLVAESNRQNQKAQDDLESLSVACENIPWDFTNNPNPPEPTLP
jgi:hypothetical protein